ncbi:hypothetical protein ACOMHN_008839 [Nucella lapillus]
MKLDYHSVSLQEEEIHGFVITALPLIQVPYINSEATRELELTILQILKGKDVLNKQDRTAAVSCEQPVITHLISFPSKLRVPRGSIDGSSRGPFETTSFLNLRSGKSIYESRWSPNSLEDSFQVFAIRFR